METAKPPSKLGKKFPEADEEGQSDNASEPAKLSKEPGEKQGGDSAETEKPSPVFREKFPEPGPGRGKPVRRRRKKGEKRRGESLRRAFEYLLSCPLGREEAELFSQNPGLSPGMTVRQAIAAAQVAKAVKGDAKAFELIRNTVGEKSGEEARFSDLPRVIIVRKEGAAPGPGRREVERGEEN